eukprot:724994_1
MSVNLDAGFEPLQDYNSLTSDSNTNTITASTASPREAHVLTSPMQMMSPIINWASVYDKKRCNPFMAAQPIRLRSDQPTVYYQQFGLFQNPNFKHVQNNHGCLSIFGQIPESPMPFHFCNRNTICDPTQRVGVYSCYATPKPTHMPPPYPIPRPIAPVLPLPPVAPSYQPAIPPLPLLERLPPQIPPACPLPTYAWSHPNTNSSELLPLKTTKSKPKTAIKKKPKCLNTRLNKVDKAKAFKCVVCSKSFRNKSGLSNHKIIHNQSKPHKCTYQKCKKAFGRSCDLTRHLRLHTGQKPFKCTTCGKAFTRSVQLRLHVMDHTGKRPYHCSICKKGFKTLQNEKIHMRIHTGEKPYECDFCHKKFTQSSSLRTHLSSIHN